MYIQLTHWNPISSTGLEVWNGKQWEKALANHYNIRPNSVYRYISLRGDIEIYFRTEDFPLCTDYKRNVAHITYLTELEVLALCCPTMNTNSN